MESRYTWQNQALAAVRNIAVTGAVVLLLAYLVISSNEAARKELEAIFSEAEERPTIVEEPVVYGYENGAKIWEVRTEVAIEHKATESSELDRIYELILFKGGEENVHIRGNRGVWDDSREQLTLTGDVQVESADGTTFLRTEELTWREDTKTLTCPQLVDFRVEENHIVANSLFSSDDLVTIDFVGDIEMFVVGLKGEGFITREGDLPLEDIQGESTGDGMNIIAAYVHYDKNEKSCVCLPEIPLGIQAKYRLDEMGRPLPDVRARALNPEVLLSDPAYVESLSRSISEMELSETERAFLEGRLDTLPPPGQASPYESGVSATSPEQTVPLGGMRGGLPQSPGFSAPPQAMGPPVPAAAGVPRIPPSDPEIVLSSPDYSKIQGWEIASDLAAEKFEGDPDFDPYAEARDGQVFCYRKDKKIWCEELHIDLGKHSARALRRADARFKDLREENREPAESRVGQAIERSPTQIIGNYVVHNWAQNVTEGYGRVLAMQPEKDIEADNIVYYEDVDAVHAWGNVIVHQFGGRWWETSGALQEIREERARTDVTRPAVIVADAVLAYNKRVSWAFGNVVFRQEHQLVRADRAQYEDTTEILVVAGNVSFESQKGERLQCAILTMDLRLEEYIAEGAAIVRNVIPEEERENLRRYREDQERKPEDDARRRLLEHRTAAGLGDWSEAAENPPTLPPINMMPGESERIQPLPPLGPEVPPPALPGSAAPQDRPPQSSGEVSAGESGEAAPSAGQVDLTGQPVVVQSQGP